MPANVTLTLFLAYYWTGYDAGFFGEPSYGWPIHRKAAERSAPRKIVVGMFWPITAIRKKEFGLFASYFIASSVVIALTLKLAVPHIGVFWAIMLIGVLRTLPVPFASRYYNGAVLLLQMIVFVVPQLILRRSRTSDDPLLRRGLEIERARHL